MKLNAVTLVVILFALARLSASAQDTQFPNELSGFEFFQNRKLNALKLLVSTKADVARVMGKGCEHGCDYDADWEIGFSYVNSGWSRTIDNVLYKPKAEFDGKLAGITFRPRRTIVLTVENIFPAAFECRLGVTKSSDFKYRSRLCTDGDRKVHYNIAAESVSDGTSMVLVQQIMGVSYSATKKDDDAIFAVVEK